jgi:hypothetical protein
MEVKFWNDAIKKQNGRMVLYLQNNVVISLGHFVNFIVSAGQIQGRDPLVEGTTLDWLQSFSAIDCSSISYDQPSPLQFIYMHWLPS